MFVFRPFRYFSRLSAHVVAAAIAAVALLPLTFGATARAQANFDRPGGDYAHLEIVSGDPAACAMFCERDRRCRSWSFNYPSVKRGSAICWLKSSVPRRVSDTCCVSGVRGAGVVELRNRKIEAATDRYGGDYRSITVPPDSEGDHCKAACEADNRCRAWTYARPGYVGRDARCYLKDRIKPPRRKPGFISGVVR